MISELFAGWCDLGTRISESASAAIEKPGCGATVFAQKKVALRTFRRQEKCFKCVIIHERPTNVCILSGL